MATVCDVLAKEHGAEDGIGKGLSDLAGSAGEVGRECCSTGHEAEKRKIEDEEGDEVKEGSVAGMGGQPS